MNQNRKFRLKYDELRENNPGAKEVSDNASMENKLHDKGGHARNICFAWPDGKRKFFSYAYLISGELIVDDEVNVITLSFTSDVVTLKGYALEQLFIQLSNHAPSLVIQDDPRYAESRDGYTLIEIAIVPIL